MSVRRMVEDLPGGSTKRRKEVPLDLQDSLKCAELVPLEQTGAKKTTMEKEDKVATVPGNAQPMAKADQSDCEVSAFTQFSLEDHQTKMCEASKESDGSQSDSDSSSSASSSKSSTSSSSCSSTDEEDDEITVQEEEEDEGECSEEYLVKKLEEQEQTRETDYQACCAAQVRRDDLVWILKSLPRLEAEEALKNAWVRITVHGGHLLARIIRLDDVEPYQVVAGTVSSIKVALRCRRCTSTSRTYNVTNISNQDVTMEEFEQWIKLTEKHGSDFTVFRRSWKDKARALRKARSFTFDDKVVAGMLQHKQKSGVNMEFDAQKESRLRGNVQGCQTQMELCGLRNIRASEIEQRYQTDIEQIERLSKRSAKLQQSWFESRPNLFSLKDVNVKNKQRETARDKHALNYTYAGEEEAAQAIKEGRTVLANPFERRPCRPKNAWDAKLTDTKGLDKIQACVIGTN